MGKKYQNEHQEHAEPAHCEGQAKIDMGCRYHDQIVDVKVVAEIEKCKVAEASCDTYEMARAKGINMHTHFRAGVSQGIYRCPDPPPPPLPPCSDIIQI